MTILPQLERNLRHAAAERLRGAGDPATAHRRPQDRPAGRAPTGRRARATGSGLLLLMSAAIAAVIIAVALLAVHHAPRPAPAPATSSAAQSRRQLVDVIGLLRNPQIQDERERVPIPEILGVADGFARLHRPLPPAVKQQFAQTGFPRVDWPLVRAVHAATGYKVWIIPVTYQPSPTANRREEGVIVSITPGHTINPASFHALPINAATLRVSGAGIFRYTANGTNDGAIIVPDGVAQVKLSKFRVVQPFATVRPTVIANTTAVVHDNVAALTLHLPIVATSNPSGLYSVQAIAHLTWLDARGAVIRQATTVLHLVIRLRGPRPPKPSASGSAPLNSMFCQLNPQAC